MATNDKYDRQLRLWGAKGQKALGETTVVLLRATAAGTETMKNLVLPGIGNVLIVDDAAFVQKEYASNFFLAASNGSNSNDNGRGDDKSRAQVASELLSELNNDVQMRFMHVPEGLATACSKDEWWSSLWQTTASQSPRVLVVASDLEPPLLQLVGRACSAQGTPLIAIQSYGLLGICRLQTPPLPILDPKPTTTPPDLRLVQPFARLQELTAGINWENLKDHEHGHVPYPLVLAKISSEWRASHDGALPKTPAEKQEFRQAIKAMSRDINKEVNFEEAMNNAYLAYSEKTLDLDYLASLRDQVTPIASTSPSLKVFAALLVALDEFMKQHGNQAPLHGTIPDMTASTEFYVEIQKAYHDQAACDLEEMRSYLPEQDVSQEDVTTFCQNVHSMELFQTRTFEEETTPKLTEELQEDWMMATMDPYEVPEHTPFLWYLGFRGCQLFYDTHGRYPGVMDAYQEDVAPLQECIVQVVTSLGLQENELVQSTLLSAEAPKFAQELARYGQAEIHNIASLVGGVASQEAVKCITNQYIPCDNTYIYNGIASVAATYKF